jgi:diphthine-ammonia ligase
VKVLSSWSGGKDSCFALMCAKAMGLRPVSLLNMMNEDGLVSRSHRIPKHILQLQADAMTLPLVTSAASWSDYEQSYIATLQHTVSQYAVEAAVFGDIDIESHRAWEEKVCAAAGIRAVLPLWQQDRKTLLFKMLRQGIKTYIVSCLDSMKDLLLGKLIDENLIAKMEKAGIDVCGENGEYHTLVVDCELFQKEISLRFGKKITHEKYCFIEME